MDDNKIFGEILEMQRNLSSKMDKWFDEFDKKINRLSADIVTGQKTIIQIQERQSSIITRLGEEEAKSKEIYKSLFQEGGLLSRVDVLNTKTILIASGISTILTSIVLTIIMQIINNP